MPYKLQKKGDKWCVLNKETGEDKGCSDSRELGLRHMRALYANSDSKALDGLCGCDICLTLDQYDSLDEIVDTKQQIDLAEVARAIVDRAKQLITGSSEPASSEISFTKDSSTGRTRVMMRVSNNFKDRHGEIITEEAHKEYEQYVLREKDYPEFQLWHTDGSRWGQADLVSFDDGFLTVSGLVDEDKEYVAEGLSRQKDLGVSHGFQGWSTGDGLIHWYRMKECSPLPRAEAANTLTSLDVLAKERGMNDKKRKFFTDVGIPSAVLDEWDKTNKDFDALARQAGFEFKDVEAPPASEPEEDDKTEVTLPDGSKALVAKAAIQVQAPVVNGTTQIDDSQMPEWAKQLVESNKALTGEVTKLKEGQTADYLEAALKSGRGFVGSKDGESPSGSEQKANTDWEQELAQLIIGNGGSR